VPLPAELRDKLEAYRRRTAGEATG
jgi:hypothetical protein